jgi:uncharacterized protein (DUF1330 family)
LAAYVIVDIEVKDPAGYAQYRELAPAIVAQYGGKYLARGGKVETLEGDWNPNRFVILEFPSLAQAKAWWSSEEYSSPKQLRYATTNSKMIVVEGVS